MQTTQINLEAHIPVGYSANAINLRTTGVANETLVHVLIGADFIAGSTVNLRSWIVMPSGAISLATPLAVASRVLPPVRQTRATLTQYLSDLNLRHAKVWRVGGTEPLPPRQASVQGGWLALLDPDTETADFLVPLSSLARLELPGHTLAQGRIPSVGAAGEPR